MGDEAPEPPQPPLTTSDVTGIVGLFNVMLASMEARLVAKLDGNTRMAVERWAMHDARDDKNAEMLAERFGKLEASILKVETCLDTHLDKEREEDIANKARVQPVVMSAKYLSTNWKTILLVVFSLLALAGFIDETAVRLLP